MSVVRTYIAALFKKTDLRARATLKRSLITFSRRNLVTDIKDRGCQVKLSVSKLHVLNCNYYYVRYYFNEHRPRKYL